MISKEDVKHYLDKMLQVELDMKKNYDMLSKEVSDPRLKKVFEQLTRDEAEHAVLVRALQSLLKNWK